MFRKTSVLFFLAFSLVLAIPDAASALDLTVTRFDDPVPGGCDPGDCSLREAVIAANSNVGVYDRVLLNTGQYDLTIPATVFCDPTGTTGSLNATEELAIIGQGKDATIINATPGLMDRVLCLFTGGITPAIFEITGLTIQNGDATLTGEGGGIFGNPGDSTLTLSDCRVINNSSVSFGGGIFNAGPLSLNDCHVDGNTSALGGGGGIWMTTGIGGLGLTVVDSTINGNKTTDGEGGGIFAAATFGRVLFLNSQVNDNQILEGAGAGGAGGGIFLINSLGGGDFLGVEVAGNSAQGDSGDGGGIFISSIGTLTIQDSIFRANTAEGLGLGGGGLLLGSANSLVMDQTLIDGNSAGTATTPPGFGGGGFLAISLFATVISNSTISNNSAIGPGGSGGGLLLGGSPFGMDISNTTISGNKATGDGGGIILPAGSGQFFLNNVTLTDNIADSDGDTMGDGGGILNFGGFPVTLQNTILSGNSAPSPGDPDCVGLFASRGYNILGVVAPTAPACFLVPDPVTDLVGVDPLLGALADNGGPFIGPSFGSADPLTTHALLAGSPAIDGGNPAGCTDGVGIPLDRDERGQVRPAGVDCDIGAYEKGLSDLAVVKTASPEGAAIGDDITFTVTVSNLGPDKNFNVLLTDTLSAGWSLVSVATPVGTCSSAGLVITCLLGTMDPGTAIIVTIVATAEDSGDLSNTAVVAGSEEDPDPSNNSFTVTIPVNFLSGTGCQLNTGAIASVAGRFSWLWVAGLPLLWMLRNRRS